MECEAARPEPAADGQGEEAEAVVVVGEVGRKESLLKITPGSRRDKVRQNL